MVFDDDAMLAGIVDARLGAGFYRTQEHVAATAHAHLYAPSTAVPPIRFSAALTGLLDSCLGEAPRFAACCPNEEFSEFTTQGGGVRPKDPGSHAAACVSAVRAAMACGAGVIVLPEFSGYAKVSDQLRRLRPASGHVLVVAGSGHDASADGKMVNRSLAWVAGRRSIQPNPPIETLKRVPYAGALGAEVIKCGTEIVVHADGPWRLVIGICRDLLDPSVVSALGSVGVNLILVPASRACVQSEDVQLSRSWPCARFGPGDLCGGQRPNPVHGEGHHHDLQRAG